jgi:periplasmic protein TonB
VKRLLMAAVAAVAIHALLLLTTPPWHGKLRGKWTDTPISLNLQVLSPPKAEEETLKPIDLPIEPPKEQTPIPDPVREQLPEPLPEPPPQLEPEPHVEPTTDPEPVPGVEPKLEPVIKVEPEREPDPAEKLEEVQPVDKPKEAARKAGSDPLPEKVVKSRGKRIINSERTTLKNFNPPSPENVEAAPEPAMVKKNRLASGSSTISEPPAPAIIEAKPKYLENDPPDYPRIARRRGYCGTVVVEVFVSRTGRAEDVTLFSSSGHRILDESALSAVADWRFEPGTKNGIPVPMRVKVPVRFSLE